MASYPAVSRVFLHYYAEPVIQLFSNTMITYFLLSLITTEYHKALDEAGEPLPELPDSVNETKQYPNLGWLTMHSVGTA